MTEEALERWLVEQLAEVVEVPAARIDVHEPIAGYGLDSVKAAGLHGALERRLGRELPMTLLWDHPTVRSLAQHLAERG